MSTRIYITVIVVLFLVAAVFTILTAPSAERALLVCAVVGLYVAARLIAYLNRPGRGEP